MLARIYMAKENAKSNSIYFIKYNNMMLISWMNEQSWLLFKSTFKKYIFLEYSWYEWIAIYSNGKVGIAIQNVSIVGQIKPRHCTNIDHSRSINICRESFQANFFRLSLFCFRLYLAGLILFKIDTICEVLLFQFFCNDTYICCGIFLSKLQWFIPSAKLVKNHSLHG